MEAGQVRVRTELEKEVSSWESGWLLVSPPDCTWCWSLKSTFYLSPWCGTYVCVLTITVSVGIGTPLCSQTQSQTAGGGMRLSLHKLGREKKTVKWRLIGSCHKLYSVRAIYSIFQAATYWLFGSGGIECVEAEDSVQGDQAVALCEALGTWTSTWSSSLVWIPSAPFYGKNSSPLAFGTSLPVLM